MGVIKASLEGLCLMALHVQKKGLIKGQTKPKSTKLATFLRLISPTRRDNRAKSPKPIITKLRIYLYMRCFQFYREYRKEIKATLQDLDLVC